LFVCCYQLEQFRESVKGAEDLVREKEMLLQRAKVRVQERNAEKHQLTQRVLSLASDLELKLEEVRLAKLTDEKQCKDFERSKEKIQELEQEIEISCREQIKQLADGRREREKLEGRINELEREKKELRGPAVSPVPGSRTREDLVRGDDKSNWTNRLSPVNVSFNKVYQGNKQRINHSGNDVDAWRREKELLMKIIEEQKKYIEENSNQLNSTIRVVCINI